MPEEKGLEQLSGAQKALAELRRDARRCREGHFAASRHNQRLHRLCGVSVILANLFVGTVLLTPHGESNAEAPTLLRQWAWLPGLLAFSAASLSGVQTFFNFNHKAEGHRNLGTRYAALARQCQQLNLLWEDITPDAEKQWPQVRELSQAYLAINAEAESFPLAV